MQRLPLDRVNHHRALAEVKLQAHVQQREKGHERPRSVEVNVVCVHHDVLKALEIAEFADGAVGLCLDGVGLDGHLGLAELDVLGDFVTDPDRPTCVHV